VYDVHRRVTGRRLCAQEGRVAERIEVLGNEVAGAIAEAVQQITAADVRVRAGNVQTEDSAISGLAGFDDAF
jgi:hypothetical protein